MVNITTTLYMILLLGITVLINTILGVLIASSNKEFNIKKLLYGILKSIIVAICLFLFTLTLELLPLVLSKVNIQISDGIPEVIEIVLTCLTAYKKYALDCFEKFKLILNGTI